MSFRFTDVRVCVCPAATMGKFRKFDSTKRRSRKRSLTLDLNDPIAILLCRRIGAVPVDASLGDATYAAAVEVAYSAGGAVDVEMTITGGEVTVCDGAKKVGALRRPRASALA